MASVKRNKWGLDPILKSANADFVTILTKGWDKTTKTNFDDTQVVDKSNMTIVNCINRFPDKDDILIILQKKERLVEVPESELTDEEKAIIATQ